MSANILAQLVSRFYHFIKDAYFHKKSLADLWRTDRRRFWAMVLFLGLFSFSVITGPRMFIISYDYVVLRRKYVALEQRYNSLLDASDKSFGTALAPNTGGQTTNLPDIDLDAKDERSRLELYSSHYQEMIQHLNTPP